MCRAARFYGWTPKEIDEMDCDVFKRYAMGLRQIEAQEFLVLTEIAAFTKQKESAQKKFLNRMNRLAHPPRQNKAMSMEELKEFLGG